MSHVRGRGRTFEWLPALPSDPPRRPYLLLVPSHSPHRRRALASATTHACRPARPGWGRALTRAASATRGSSRHSGKMPGGRPKMAMADASLNLTQRRSVAALATDTTRQAAGDQRRLETKETKTDGYRRTRTVALDCRFPRLRPSHACHNFGSVLSVRGPCSITQSRSSGSRHVRMDAWTRMHTMAHFSRTI